MIPDLDDANFNDFINSSFYCAVGFYSPYYEKKNEIFETFEEFNLIYDNLDLAAIDVTKNKTPAAYGIDEDTDGVIILFKQGKPFRAFRDNFTVEDLRDAMTAPGKNITLQ